MDFGAVQAYSASFLDPVIQMIRSSYEGDLPGVVDGGIRLRFMSQDWPEDVLDTFGKVCMSVLEPLSRDRSNWPDEAVNDRGQYRWKQSDLPPPVGSTTRESRSASTASIASSCRGRKVV